MIKSAYLSDDTSTRSTQNKDWHCATQLSPRLRVSFVPSAWCLKLYRSEPNECSKMSLSSSGSRFDYDQLDKIKARKELEECMEALKRQSPPNANLCPAPSSRVCGCGCCCFRLVYQLPRAPTVADSVLSEVNG